jgi:hypothetical protein
VTWGKLCGNRIEFASDGWIANNVVDADAKLVFKFGCGKFASEGEVVIIN